LNECDRAFQVREVCVDFEELRGFQGDCQREGISDERPSGGRGGGGGLVERNVGF
jgi:hypothetical protein